MKKISNKSINMNEKLFSSGITLITLVVTIIILLILSGVTINVLIGDDGLIRIAKKSGEEYEKSVIKEEIESAILHIKIEKIQKDEKLTMEILEQELPNKLKDIIVEKDEEGQIVGEYKDYDYTITKEYEVIIEKKGIKPVVTYTLSDETIGINELTIKLTATVSEGIITKIVKPDENYEENVNEVRYKVNENGKYRFIVEGSNGARTIKIIEINNLKPKMPEIKAEGAYPTLTQYGVEGAKISIIYEENENLEHYYSEDNGTTWKIYNGEFEPENSTIIAKSIVKKNPECYTEIKMDNAIPEDALGAQAYDGDEETYQSIGKKETKKILVAKEMQGKNIRFKADDLGCLQEVNSLGEVKTIVTIRWDLVDVIVKLSEDVKELYFYDTDNTGYYKVYEIQPSGTPELKDTKYYPTLTEYGVIPGYNEVSIDYFETSIDRQYRINGGNWQKYENKPIKLKIGDILEAKGIDKYGKETLTSSYNAVLPEDALGVQAYDGDEETYQSIGKKETKKILVAKEMQGKNIRFKADDLGCLQEVNSLGEVKTIVTVRWDLVDVIVKLSEDVKELYFYDTDNTGYYKVYEIQPE